MKKRRFPWISIIVLFIISQSLLSCFYGIKGNGKVLKSERQVVNIKSISVSSGFDLILVQDSLEKLTVEADENLQKIIKTDVTQGELKIYTSEPIYRAKSLKVRVTIKSINSLEASSGADVQSESTLKFSFINISASSGAEIKLTILSSDIQAKTSSGSDISLSGKSVKLIIHSSSGSDVDAEKLICESCSVEASSGSQVKVSAEKMIEAHASSGSNIQVTGNPTERDIEKSSGGSVTIK